MSPPTYNLVLSAHLISVVLWISGLTAIYWLLRLHDHAPREMHEKLTLLERSLALSVDIASTVAIACGIAMAVSPINLFTTKGGGWLHIKIVVVIAAILSVQGMLRGRIKKFAQGKINPVPGWQWSLLLAGMTIAIILATTKLQSFFK